jgi:hypothetical protein
MLLAFSNEPISNERPDIADRGATDRGGAYAGGGHDPKPML